MPLHHHALWASLAAALSFCLAACGDDKSATESSDGTTTAATTAATTGTAETTTGTDASTGLSTGTTDSVTTGMTQDASTSGSSSDGATTGSTTELDTTGMAGLSFAADVYSVLNPPTSCDCHTPGSGGLQMGDVDTAYTNLVGVMSTESPLKRVEPGSVDDSYMWHKLSGTHLDVGGSGKAMPLGAPALAKETLDLIKEWIDGGAQP